MTAGWRLTFDHLICPIGAVHRKIDRPEGRCSCRQNHAGRELAPAFTKIGEPVAVASSGPSLSHSG